MAAERFGAAGICCIMERKMKKRLFGSAVCFLVILLLFSCTREEPSSAALPDTPQTAPSSLPRAVDVIRLEGGDWGYPSPYAHYPRGPGGFKMCLIFDSLLERGDKGLIPWLAEKYEILENGKVYRFSIRKGVTWQDGKPLTPEDVRFSIEYANRHPMTWSYIFHLIEKVETGPGHTVQVFLKQPAAPMLYNLGLTRILPKHIWETVDQPKEFTAPEAVIGSGPYCLKEYSREHGTYRFEAFEDFWGPRQRVRRIEFIPVSQPVLAYENREIDLTPIIPDLLPRFSKDPANKIIKGPGFWGCRLLFNMKNAASLGDKRVRQAFAHAIDRNEIVDKILRGAAIPGRAGILPPDHVMAADKVKEYDFRPEKAEALLQAAGFVRSGKNGVRQGPDGSRLSFELLCSSVNNRILQEVRLAEILKQRLSAVGIKTVIRSVDEKTRDARIFSHDFQLAILGHGGWGQDPEYLTAHFSGEFSTRTSSPSMFGMTGFEVPPELASLLVRQQVEIDPARRRSLVEQIQHQAAELVPEIPLFYTTGYTVYRPATYDGWMFMFDHHSPTHSKLSYLEWKES